jgi:hypothetical protein
VRDKADEVVADVDRVNEGRMVSLLAPLAARTGFKAGDGAALWRELQREACRTVAAVSVPFEEAGAFHRSRSRGIVLGQRHDLA